MAEASALLKNTVSFRPCGAGRECYIALVILTVAGWVVGDAQNLPLGATADIDEPHFVFNKLRKV